jgi:hypothetical protein
MAGFFSGLGSLLTKGVGALGNMFGGGGGGQSMQAPGMSTQTPGFGAVQNIGFPALGSQMSASPWGGAGQGGGGFGGGLSKMFNSQGGKLALGGLGMLGSQLIPSPKQPSMPDSYNQFMQMMQGGGTPGMQQAQGYYSGVLSGQNKDMYEAAGHSLDLNYQEQLRQLNSMYKSLRPGTDPTTDSTYQRDLNNLNDAYARQKAQTMAQVQQGAAAGAAGLGQSQMSGMMAGMQPQLDQLATQWGMDAQKRQALMGSVLGLGQGLVGSAFSDPQTEVMKKMFPGLYA